MAARASSGSSGTQRRPPRPTFARPVQRLKGEAGRTPPPRGSLPPLRGDSRRATGDRGDVRVDVREALLRVSTKFHASPSPSPSASAYGVGGDGGGRGYQSGWVMKWSRVRRCTRVARRSGKTFSKRVMMSSSAALASAGRPRVQQHALHRRHDDLTHSRNDSGRVGRHRRGNHTAHHRRGRRHAEQHAHGDIPGVAQRQRRSARTRVSNPSVSSTTITTARSVSWERLRGTRTGTGAGATGRRDAVGDRTRAGKRSSREGPARVPTSRVPAAAAAKAAAATSFRFLAFRFPRLRFRLRRFRLPSSPFRFRAIDRFVFFRDFAVPCLRCWTLGPGQTRVAGAGAGACSGLPGCRRATPVRRRRAATTAAGRARDDCGSTFVAPAAAAAALRRPGASGVVGRRSEERGIPPRRWW